MTTAFCRQGAERKWRPLLEEEARSGVETVFTADVIPLSQFTTFKYLGWIITAADDNWPALVGNLRKARQKWAQLTRVLGREGADARNSGHILLALV